ncbi:MAG TPA: PH domain-containing protein [Mycobacteriales bacterium]|nr:PH domain-containing protein [Mycobacteriales bacterium]
MSPPLVVRPRRLAWMAWAMALTLTGVFGLVGFALTRSEGELQFGLVDAVAMTGLGALLGGCALLLTRARVVAGADGVRVRNVLGDKGFPWGVVREVRFPDGASWASLELQDDETVALLAVQANDGVRAQEAVRALRALLAESRQRP